MPYFFTITIGNSSDFSKTSLPVYVIFKKIVECLFSFAHQYSCHFRHFCQKFFRIIRNLRSTGPESSFRKNFGQITNQFPYKRNIPDITGETDNVCSTAINIFKNLILWLIDRVFPKKDFLIIIRGICFQIINSQI